PALGTRPPGTLRRDLAPRTPPDRPGIRRRAPRRDGRLALDGVPRPARESLPRRARGLPAPRGLRVRLRRDRARDRKEPGQLSAGRGASPPTGRREAASVRGLAEAAGGARSSVLRRDR